MNIFEIIFGDYMGGLVELANSLLENSFATCLYIEKEITGFDFNRLYIYIGAFSFGLLTLKLLYKLFNVYIICVDGDSNTSPIEYLKNYAKAIIISFSFTFLYGYLASISIELCNGIMKMFNVALVDKSGLENFINTVTNLHFIVILVYLILACVLYISILMNGSILLILRLGIPISTVGIIDGGNNKFTTLVQIMVKIVITTIAQIVLFNISFMCLSFSIDGNILSRYLSVAIIVGAFKIPTMLNEIFIGSVGSGMGGKAVSLAMTVKNFIKR